MLSKNTHWILLILTVLVGCTPTSPAKNSQAGVSTIPVERPLTPPAFPTQEVFPAEENPPTAISPGPGALPEQEFIPTIVSDCSLYNIVTDNHIINGSFERGEDGWVLYSTGTGATWRNHPLIIAGAPLEPRDGEAYALLGGYEGSRDRLRQLVVIPPGGRLTYSWYLHQPLQRSELTVSLIQPGNEFAIILAFHQHDEPVSGWQQDCLDLSAYAGQEYLLEFYVFNDNYTSTAFGIDKVVLGSEGE